MLNPIKESMDINSNDEIKVEANPTCVVEYNLATTVQKRKPNPEITTEFTISHTAFL